MLRSYETILESVKDADILTIHTLSGAVMRGHWYEDHMLRELCRVNSFTQIGPLEYQQNDVY